MTAEAIEHRTAHAPTREEVVLYNRRVSEAALRAADRRRREDDAPRLHDAVPALDSLRLEIEERRGGGVLAGGTHIRRILVEHAPALFDLPCGDRTCKDGGHDLTRVILGALQTGVTRFEGEDPCSGWLGTAPCGSVLRYVGVATYRGGPT